uniref:lysozyme n=1 Tax=Urechis unicinctus TaxID=6432 RepID=A0A2S0S3Y4_UREUN|nr:invertebrate-type lysozyme [Urechis unicinctus]
MAAWTLVFALVTTSSLVGISEQLQGVNYSPVFSGLNVAAISNNCLSCICHVEGCERQVGKCRMDRGSLSCGPFQIKEPYWIDCGRPGTGWQPCAKQMVCSVNCVRAYMERYGTYCTGGRPPTCEDYAKIHNGGPRGCTKPLESYWRRVKACCDASFGGRC